MSLRDFSVVICVYTEDRWEDILAAVDSVRAQSLPARKTLLAVDRTLTKGFAVVRGARRVRRRLGGGP